MESTIHGELQYSSNVVNKAADVHSLDFHSIKTTFVLLLGFQFPLEMYVCQASKMVLFLLSVFYNERSCVCLFDS